MSFNVLDLIFFFSFKLLYDCPDLSSLCWHIIVWHDRLTAASLVSRILARVSASGLYSVHIIKCSAFASKGILESLQSCTDLHFEEGDLKVVVVMSIFVITVRLSFKKASTLLCTAFVHLHYHTLLFRTGL